MIQKLLEKYKDIPEERFFKELFEKNEYESVLDRKADIVVDVGACAGEFSAYIYDKAKTIYAIEPYSKAYKELENNIKEFGLTKIKPFRVALSDYVGTGELANDVARGANTMVDIHGETEKVPVTTLATFMKEQAIDHIDILKIDIEGAEFLVFGSEDFKDVASKIRFIIGEHMYGLPGETLKGLGFQEIYLRDNNNIIYENTTSNS